MPMEGNEAGVCTKKNDIFVCPTTNSSTNVICDTARCPLHGLSMAPVMKQQKFTGTLAISHNKCNIRITDMQKV